VLVGVALLLSACSGSAGRAAPTTATTSTTTTTAPPPTTTTTAGPPASRLQAVVDDSAARAAAPYSIVVVDLATGTRAEHLADRQVLSASLYKLFVARELVRRVQAGALSSDASAQDGTGRTVGQCITDMIVVSDDQCGVAGLRIVGYGALDAGLARDGYVHTRLASPQRTSASDVALFFRRTHATAAADPVSGQLYDLLQRQQVNDRFPLGLPPGTPIAHKTGDRIGWAHDAGIITTPRGEVLLAALSGPYPAPCCKAERPGPAERAAFAALADVARRVYALYS